MAFRPICTETTAGNSVSEWAVTLCDLCPRPAPPGATYGAETQLLAGKVAASNHVDGSTQTTRYGVIRVATVPTRLRTI